MSKPVRISDYLAAELQKIADQENRSLANLVQHLLTQALQMPERYEPPVVTVSPEMKAEIDSLPERPFKPDFK
jgi:hypothetical protein